VNDNKKVLCTRCGHDYPPMRMFLFGKVWRCSDCYIHAITEKDEELYNGHLLNGFKVVIL
jgi:late competence protein required for DNA uptake (superfamily II DNA/RNA helicase)